MVLQGGLLQFTAVLRRAKGDYARMSVNLTPSKAPLHHPTQPQPHPYRAMPLP